MNYFITDTIMKNVLDKILKMKLKLHLKIHFEIMTAVNCKKQLFFYNFFHKNVHMYFNKILRILRILRMIN